MRSLHAAAFAVVAVCLCAPAFAQLAVDPSGLTPAQRTAFDKLLTEEVCPCDCPKTLGQCLQVGTKCQPAVLLAEWAIKAMEEGTPEAMVAESLAREITGGFTAPARTPVTTGFSTKGAAKPAHVIVEYADFECGHCRAAASIMDQLVKKRSDVKVVFKHFPLSFHAMAKKAAIAAEAAGRQNKFWPMHDALFATQDILSDELILGHAKALGLDVARFQKDLVDPALAQRVDESRSEGASFGIEATPAIFIDGRPYFLSRSVDGIELRLRMDAARASSSCK
jgi:protein-disulfide isomerase